MTNLKNVESEEVTRKYTTIDGQAESPWTWQKSLRPGPIKAIIILKARIIKNPIKSDRP